MAGDGHPVKILNDNTEAPLPPGHQRIAWSDVLTVSHCNLIVEDLIACTEAELKILLKVANYNTHHKLLYTVVMIAHDSNNNGIFPLLKHMSHVCFMTTSRANSASVAAVLVELKVPKAERDAKVEAFLADVGQEEHGYWVLDVKTGAFERRPGSLLQTSDTVAAGDAPLAVVDRKSAVAPYRKTAENYLSLFSTDPKKSMAIFDYLMTKTPLHSLNPVDLNFTLRDQKKGGQVVRVSLFDYIHTLTTDVAPTQTVMDLHAYLSRYVTLPRCFIVNRHKKFASQ